MTDICIGKRVVFRVIQDQLLAGTAVYASFGGMPECRNARDVPTATSLIYATLSARPMTEAEATAAAARPGPPPSPATLAPSLRVVEASAPGDQTSFNAMVIRAAPLWAHAHGLSVQPNSVRFPTTVTNGGDPVGTIEVSGLISCCAERKFLALIDGGSLRLAWADAFFAACTKPPETQAGSDKTYTTTIAAAADRMQKFIDVVGGNSAADRAAPDARG